MKTLKRPRNPEARKRFRREVASYETLDHGGIPELLDHNGDAWEDLGTPLFVALEYIEGSTLKDWVKLHGPMPLEVAFAFGVRLMDIVSECHREDILHRDLKPSNIMLRHEDPADPVVVDFGLAFNTVAEVSDVTAFGEEIGNRFLRLPEAWNNRTPISDVTQAAGLMLYAMTGTEPHSLLDEGDNPPHRRSATEDRLKALAPERRSFSRLITVFDRAFTTSSRKRFQTAQEFRDALVALMEPNENDAVDQLSVHFSAYLQEQQAEIGRAEGAAARLDPFIKQTTAIANQLANETGLQLSQSGYIYGARTWLALAPRTRKPPPYAQFDFELRGGDGVVLLIDGKPEWTGTDTGDPELKAAIRSALMTSYLTHFRDGGAGSDQTSSA